MNVVLAEVMVEPLGWMIVHSLWLLLLPFVGLMVGLWLLPEHRSRARYAAALGTLCVSVLIAAVFVSVVPQNVDASDQATEPVAVEETAADDVSDPDPVALSAAPVDVPLPTEKFPSFAKFPASGTGLRVKLDDRRWVEFHAMASVDKINNEDLKVFWKADGELIDAPKSFDPTVLVPDLVDDRMPEVNREVLVQVVGPKGNRVGMSTSGYGGHGNFTVSVDDEFDQFPLNNSISGIRSNHAYVELSVTKEHWEDVPVDDPEIARVLYNEERSIFNKSQIRVVYVLAAEAFEFAWTMEVQPDGEESFPVTPGRSSSRIDNVLPKPLQETLDPAAKKLQMIVFFFEYEKPMPKVIRLQRSRYDYVRFDNLSVFPGPRSAVRVSVNGIPVTDGDGAAAAPLETVAVPEAEVTSEGDEQQKPEYLALTGTVVDSKDQPVSTCWVGMFTDPQVSNEYKSPSGFDDGPDLSHEGLTDANGRFTIFARKTHFVFEGAFWAVGRDGASGVKLLNATWAHTKDNLKIRIDDKVGAVRVLDPDGQPVPKAKVTLEAVKIPRSVTRRLPLEVQQRQMATTDENGIVKFLGWPSAAIRGVAVTVDGYGTQVLNHRLASRWVNGDEPLPLTLRQTASLNGRVEGFDLKQHSGLQLQVLTETYDGKQPRLEGLGSGTFIASVVHGE